MWTAWANPYRQRNPDGTLGAWAWEENAGEDDRNYFILWIRRLVSASAQYTSICLHMYAYGRLIRTYAYVRIRIRRRVQA